MDLEEVRIVLEEVERAIDVARQQLTNDQVGVEYATWFQCFEPGVPRGSCPNG